MSLTSKEVFLILKEENPNSLGRLLEIYQLVLDQKLTTNQVYELYQSEDVIVSMRVPNIIKRLWRLNPSYVLPLIPLFLKDEKRLINPAFRWTISQVFKEFYPKPNEDQKLQIIDAIIRNLTLGNDWIMLVQSIDALITAKKKGYLIKVSKKIIARLANDSRKVVKNKALALIKILE